MKVPIRCECGKELKANEDMIGMSLTCPRCRSEIAVTEAALKGASAGPVPITPQVPIARRWICPTCGSDLIDMIENKRALAERMQASNDGAAANDSEQLNRAFIFYCPRECRKCGAIWIPSLPRWIGLPILGAGLLLISGIIAVWMAEPGILARKWYMPILGVAVGILATGYGCFVLAGAKGAGMMIREGRKSPNS